MYFVCPEDMPDQVAFAGHAREQGAFGKNKASALQSTYLTVYNRN